VKSRGNSCWRGTASAYIFQLIPFHPRQAAAIIKVLHTNRSITESLQRSCRKGHVWKSKPLLTAFKNAEYGFDEKRSYSPGGSDGVFVITRDHKPPDNMMKKLFDQYIDRPNSGIGNVVDQLGTSIDRLIPVRLVSHHMRLLSLLHRQEDKDELVLVDYDNTK
jgi:hypothetical protein